MYCLFFGYYISFCIYDSILCFPLTFAFSFNMKILFQKRKKYEINKIVGLSTDHIVGHKEPPKSWTLISLVLRHLLGLKLNLLRNFSLFQFFHFFINSKLPCGFSVKNVMGTLICAH
jgi:hypothetical protein